LIVADLAVEKPIRRRVPVLLLLVGGLTTAGTPPPTYQTRNSADEPIAAAYSTDKAITFVERSVTHWQKKRRCVTCHTNGIHLVAGAQTTPESDVLARSQAFARAYLKGYVTEELKPKGQHGAIEGLVSTASFLAISEMTTDQKLHPQTVAALDYVWKRQDKSGAWGKWLKCNWGPYEVDDHYGVSLAALALAMTPESYRQQPLPMQAGQRMHRYLTATLPGSGHQKAMMLWVAKYAPGTVSHEQKLQWIDDLRALQQTDGGWALIHLGDKDWKREDDAPQVETSDGYATATVIFALRQAGVPSRDPAVRRGVAWLKTHQRQSGRWFTHSPRRDGKHYITQAATNMALMALASCDELD
jgi:squalene-hopene/tetraprenyl-beta-curcumene cyclase